MLGTLEAYPRAPRERQQMAPNRAFGGGDQVVPCGVDGRVTVMCSISAHRPRRPCSWGRPSAVKCLAESGARNLPFEAPSSASQLSTRMVVTGPGRDPERISAIVEPGLVSRVQRSPAAVHCLHAVTQALQRRAHGRTIVDGEDTSGEIEAFWRAHLRSFAAVPVFRRPLPSHQRQRAPNAPNPGKVRLPRDP